MAYAYEIFEHFKNKSTNATKEQKIGAAIVAARDCYNYFKSIGVNEDEDVRICQMAFGMIACNDGKIRNEEHELYKKIFGDCTYDEFFNIMQVANKQAFRDTTVGYFKMITDRKIAERFLIFCFLVSSFDGDIDYREESLITSLCGVYLDKFGR